MATSILPVALPPILRISLAPLSYMPTSNLPAKPVCSSFKLQLLENLTTSPTSTATALIKATLVSYLYFWMASYLVPCFYPGPRSLFSTQQVLLFRSKTNHVTPLQWLSTHSWSRPSFNGTQDPKLSVFAVIPTPAHISTPPLSSNWFSFNKQNVCSAW